MTLSLPTPSSGVPVYFPRTTGTLRMVHPAAAAPLIGTVVISIESARRAAQGLLDLVLDLYRGPSDELEFIGQVRAGLWEGKHEWGWRSQPDPDQRSTQSTANKEYTIVDIVQSTVLSIDGTNLTGWAIQLELLFHDGRMADIVQTLNQRQLPFAASLAKVDQQSFDDKDR